MTTLSENNSSIVSFYETNEDFKQYVDKYCRTYRITVEQALTHVIVQNVMKYYKSE